MPLVPNKANILFLRNVYPEQLETIEEEYNNRIYEEAGLTEYNYSEEIPITYDKIPPIFVDIESWPKSTNILCWYCSTEFTGRPYFIPERIKNRKCGGIEMVTHGVFCTANCAVRYLNTEYSDASSSSGNKLNNWDAYHGVKIIHRLFTNKRVERIAPSPSKTQMRQYGGDLTKTQYRELLESFEDKCRIDSFKVSSFTTLLP